MDARRDMYYFATRDGIELIKKDSLKQKILNYKESDILCDKRCCEIIKGALCFEDENKNIAPYMIKLAKEKYQNMPNKDSFNYLRISANYIQTPPVFN